MAKSRAAKQAMAAGDFRQATALYEQLVKALPENAGMRMNLGLALHSAGRYREAIPQFEEALRRRPDIRAARLFLGLAYLKLGQPAAAVEPLAKAVEAEPRDKAARLELADALLRTGRAGQAATHFEILTQADPEWAKAWQGLGLVYMALGQQAFAALEKLDPGSVYSDVLFARSVATRGRHLSAFKLYRDALAKAPAMRGLHAGLAEVYRATGHAEWAEVEDRREQALPAPDGAAHPLECEYLNGRHREVIGRAGKLQNPEAHYWSALACSKLADEAFARLARLPVSEAIHDLLAEGYSIQGKADLAVAEWEKAVALAPQDRRLKRKLARALSLADAHDRARSLAKGLLAAEPDSPELRLLLGEILARGDAFADAVPHLEAGLKHAPTDVSARETLGLAYLHLGRPRNAIPHLEAALAPDLEGKVHYQLAQAYRQTGQGAAAQKMLAKFVEISKVARTRRQPPEMQIAPP